MTRQQALRYAHYARDAYELTPVVGAKTFLAQGPFCCPYHRSCGEVTVDVFARLHHDGGEAILAFRGTDTVADWLANFDTRRCPMIDGQAHAGFRHGWLAVRDEVQAAVRVLVRQEGVQTLTITGHSKGGAEAVMAAYDLARSEIGLPVSVVTFGAPRSCDAALATAIAARLASCTHYVNGPDPVAAVPPLLWGWRQPGRTVQLRPLSALLGPLNYLRGQKLSEFHDRHHYLETLASA